MRRFIICFGLIGLFALRVLSGRLVHSQGKAVSNTVRVHMVITDQLFDDTGEVPALRPDNVKVKVGKEATKIDHLIAARGDSAALQLFVLIDDTCETSAIGSNLNDLREFITAQPPSTMVGVAYLSNATIQVAQNLAVDHSLAAKALRLPHGRSSSMDSPYLSLISLIKAWPQQNVRREILIVSDGIDRLRGDTTGDIAGDISGFDPFALPNRGRGAVTGSTINATTTPTISSDAETASNAGQRYGVIVHSIYATGVGRLGRNGWEAQLGQGGIAKITDETGGEYFALGTQNAVSFKPYLDRLQKIFDNQYFLVLQVPPRKKGGLQRVRISADADNVDIASADNVWVPVAGD